MAKKQPRPKSANPWPRRLRELRRLYGDGTRPLPQADAAARIACPVGTWRNWEQGLRKPNPMIARLLELTFPKAFSKK